MVQLINISQARSTLSTIVKNVAKTKQPVVIIQDSIPTAVLYPFEQETNKTSDTYKHQLLSISGDWFSKEEHNKLRAEVAKRQKSSS